LLFASDTDVAGGKPVQEWAPVAINLSNKREWLLRLLILEQTAPRTMNPLKQTEWIQMICTEIDKSPYESVASNAELWKQKIAETSSLAETANTFHDKIHDVFEEIATEIKKEK
jgi:hypothetical protein